MAETAHTFVEPLMNIWVAGFIVSAQINRATAEVTGPVGFGVLTEVLIITLSLVELLITSIMTMWRVCSEFVAHTSYILFFVPLVGEATWRYEGGGGVCVCVGRGGGSSSGVPTSSTSHHRPPGDGP